MFAHPAAHLGRWMLLEVTLSYGVVWLMRSHTLHTRLLSTYVKPRVPLQTQWILRSNDKWPALVTSPPPGQPRTKRKANKGFIHSVRGTSMSARHALSRLERRRHCLLKRLSLFKLARLVCYALTYLLLCLYNLPHCHTFLCFNCILMYGVCCIFQECSKLIDFQKNAFVVP